MRGIPQNPAASWSKRNKTPAPIPTTYYYNQHCVLSTEAITTMQHTGLPVMQGFIVKTVNELPAYGMIDTHIPPSNRRPGRGRAWARCLVTKGGARTVTRQRQSKGDEVAVLTSDARQQSNQRKKIDLSLFECLVMGLFLLSAIRLVVRCTPYDQPNRKNMKKRAQ